MQITKNAIMLFHTKYRYELELMYKRERKGVKMLEGKYSDTVEMRDIKAALGLHNYFRKNLSKYRRVADLSKLPFK